MYWGDIMKQRGRRGGIVSNKKSIENNAKKKIGSVRYQRATIMRISFCHLQFGLVICICSLDNIISIYTVCGHVLHNQLLIDSSSSESILQRITA